MASVVVFNTEVDGYLSQQVESELRRKMIELPINPETGKRMLVLRQSDLKKWLTDRRDFYFGVFENLEPKNPSFSKMATIGTFVHEGMKAHYLQTGDPIAAIVNAASAQVSSQPIFAGDLTDAAEFAQIIFEGYLEWIAEEAIDHGFKPVMVEERLTALIGTFSDIEVYVSGAIDLVMKDYDDLIWILDHKTTDKFSAILATLPVDFQGRTYDFLLQSSGIEATGFKHNQLKRVKRTARATPPYYIRDTVTFNETNRKTHLWHMQGIAAEVAGRFVIMEDIQKEGDKDKWEMALHFYFPPNFTKDSNWMSNFLDPSVMLDTDPNAGYEMLALAYKQKEQAV